MPVENLDFETIYRENAAIVLRYLLSIGCPAQDAEDIIQDTFVRALLSIDSYRGACKLSVWLCQIAKNRFYDSVKKQKRERSDRDIEIPDQGCNRYLEWLELIDDLNEPYRTVFIKKEIEGWSYPELAKLYGKTENWVRVTFFRAKKQVQKIFRPYVKEGL